MGSPVVCSTRTSLAPGTVANKTLAFSPASFRMSKSSPYIRTATSVRTPAINSLKRISIGCVNSYLLPGTASTAVRNSAINVSLLLLGLGHWSLGFKIKNVSATFGGMGSVATSAVPILAKTCCISPNSLMTFSNCCCISMACSRLVPGIRNACRAISCSSNCGKNSVPNRLACSALAITRTTAILTSTMGCFSDKFNNGVYH